MSQPHPVASDDVFFAYQLLQSDLQWAKEKLARFNTLEGQSYFLDILRETEEALNSPCWVTGEWIWPQI